MQDQNYFAQNVSLGNYRVNGCRWRYRPVVTQGGEVSREQFSLPHVEVSWIDRVILVHASPVDVKSPSLHRYLLTGKAHHSFHDQASCVPRHHDVTSIRFNLFERPLVNQQEVAGFERGKHAVARYDHKLVSGVEPPPKEDQGDSSSGQPSST